MSKREREGEGEREKEQKDCRTYMQQFKFFTYQILSFSFAN